MGWKPHKLEGCQGLNNFSTRLGVTTEFCRGDTNVTNVSGVHPDAPRCTPAGAVTKGVSEGGKFIGGIRKGRRGGGEAVVAGKFGRLKIKK